MSGLRLTILTTSFPLRRSSVSGLFVRQLVCSLPTGWRLEVVTSGDDSQEPVEHGERYRLRPFRYAPHRWQRLAHQPGGIPAALAHQRWLVLLLPLYLLSMLFTTWHAARRSDALLANWAICGVIAVAAGRLTGRPVVTALRGSDVARARSGRVDRLLLKLCLVGSQRVVTVSESLRDEVIALFPDHQQQIEVIANGVDGALLDLPAERDHTPPYRLLAVGSLVVNKRIDTLLDGVALLVAQGHEVRLELLGDGPERAALEQRCHDLRIRPLVDFYGICPPDQVMERLSQATLFLLASEREGRSNALLEAMAAGVPVVASRIPSVSSIIEDGVEGALFAVGDAAALASQLDRLLTDPERRHQLSRSARARVVASGWSWHGSGLRYQRLLGELLDRAATGAG